MTDNALSMDSRISPSGFWRGSRNVLPQERQRNRCWPLRSLPNFFAFALQVWQFILASLFEQHDITEMLTQSQGNSEKSKKSTKFGFWILTDWLIVSKVPSFNRISLLLEGRVSRDR